MFAGELDHGGPFFIAIQTYAIHGLLLSIINNNRFLGD